MVQSQRPLRIGDAARRAVLAVICAWLLMVAAGLPRLRFLDLRHSAASLLLAQAVAPRVVMDVLGHSQIGVTVNTYSHVALRWWTLPPLR
jgi:integrase